MQVLDKLKKWEERHTSYSSCITTVIEHSFRGRRFALGKSSASLLEPAWRIRTASIWAMIPIFRVLEVVASAAPALVAWTCRQAEKDRALLMVLEGTDRIRS